MAINLRDYQSQGIYKITALDGQIYIGSSVNTKRRIVQHRSALRLKNHSNHKLQFAHDCFGEMKYEQIVCVRYKADLIAVEQMMIDEMRPSLNLTRVARCSMLDPVVAARASAAILVSSKHAAARSKNQEKASASVSKSVVRLTDGVEFASGYAAARFHGIKHADNLSTAIKNGWKFAGHFWKFSHQDTTLEQAMARSEQSEETRKANATAGMIASVRKTVVRESDGCSFDSIANAARLSGVTNAAIQRALKYGTKSAGSRWAYV